MPNSIGIYQFNELGRIECRARERIAVIRPTQGYLSNLPQWYGRHVDGRGDCVLDSAIRRISLPILRSHWYRYVPYLKSNPQNGSLGSHRKLQLRWASGLWWWQTKAALVSRPTYCQQDCKILTKSWFLSTAVGTCRDSVIHYIWHLLFFGLLIHFNDNVWADEWISLLQPHGKLIAHNPYYCNYLYQILPIYLANKLIDWLKEN